jgi:glucose/arabinose dehydrogenase
MACTIRVRYSTGGTTGFGRALAILMLITGVVADAPLRVEAQAPRSPTATPVNGAIRVETVARGLEHPWALGFLPDGCMLVTERPGRVRLITPEGHLSEPFADVPRVQARGQGGLLDVALDPRFGENRLVYLAYAEPGEGRTVGTAVGRGWLGEGRLEDVRVIYQQQPKVEGANHFGSRLVFARDGTLSVTQGERFDYHDKAQDLSSGLGKLVWINPDGSVPRDNPFVGRAGARPEIWSYGHRNIQSAGLHPHTGQLWTVEHGARGGDELNRPEAGKNYGWPVISEAGHGAASLLLGSGDRALRHDLLHGRGIPRLAGQPPDRLVAAGAPGAADTRRRPGHGGRVVPRRPGGTHQRRAAGTGRTALPPDRQLGRPYPAGAAGGAPLRGGPARLTARGDGCS